MGRHVKLSVIVDYDEKLKIHFARGQIRYIDKTTSKSNFVQGFAILKPDVFLIFLRDNLKFDPYIIELPQHHYSISKVDRLDMTYNHGQYEVKKYGNPFVRIPRFRNFEIRHGDLKDDDLEFVTLCEFWRPNNPTTPKDIMNRHYDIFGGNPEFVTDVDDLPFVDKHFKDRDKRQVQFAKYEELLTDRNWN